MFAIALRERTVNEILPHSAPVANFTEIVQILVRPTLWFITFQSL